MSTKLQQRYYDLLTMKTNTDQCTMWSYRNDHLWSWYSHGQDTGNGGWQGIGKGNGWGEVWVGIQVDV